ncbi:MAG: GNAT family N-acetyltransferase [Atopobiaceae bacterium]
MRRAATSDLDEVLHIYECARQFMRASGNPNQWGTRFPEPATIQADIDAGQLWVCVYDAPPAARSAEELLGCLAFLPGPDPNYAHIYDGAWPSDDPYFVVHRVAVRAQGLGVGGFMMDWALDQARRRGQALRIDTHRQNLPMQGLIRSRGLTYCGVIHLGRDGSERLSYSTI